jgi:hypothetical protein
MIFETKVHVEGLKELQAALRKLPDAACGA